MNRPGNMSEFGALRLPVACAHVEKASGDQHACLGICVLGGPLLIPSDHDAQCWAQERVFRIVFDEDDKAGAAFFDRQGRGGHGRAQRGANARRPASGPAQAASLPAGLGNAIGRKARIVGLIKANWTRKKDVRAGIM